MPHPVPGRRGYAPQVLVEPTETYGFERSLPRATGLPTRLISPRQDTGSSSGTPTVSSGPSVSQSSGGSSVESSSPSPSPTSVPPSDPPSSSPSSSPSSEPPPPSSIASSPESSSSRESSSVPSSDSSSTPPAPSSSSVPPEESSSSRPPSAPPSGSSPTLSPTPSLGSPDSPTSTPSETLSSGWTLITSEIVMTIDGQLTTSHFVQPSMLSNSDNNMSSSERTGIIAGSAAGGVALLLLLFSLFFFYRRRQVKKRGFSQYTEPKPRSMLLAGEDMDEERAYSSSGTPIPPAMRYTDSPSSHARSASSDSGPRLMRARASESGSIFHEGGVWPPPSERSRLVDPIMAASEIDLSKAVDDVMNSHTQSGGVGPSRLRGGANSSLGHSTVPSVYSRSSWAEEPQMGGLGKHNRDMSTTSESGLLAMPPLSHIPEPSATTSRMQPNAGASRSTISVQNTLGGTDGRNWLDRSPRKSLSGSDNPIPQPHFPRGTPPASPRASPKNTKFLF